MAKPDGDLLQGTLDVLILKTLALEPMHGYGVSFAYGRFPRMYCESNRDLYIPPCTGSNSKA